MKINKESVSLNSFETMANYYFKEVDTKSFNAYYERPNLLRMIGSVEDKSVLDAGCAAGFYTNYFLNEKAKKVYSIDFSEEMIKMTNLRIKENENKTRAIIREFDLNNELDFIPDNSLDIIVSSLTLHYIKDLEKVFKNFKKKLKKNGKILFSMHHPFLDYMLFEKENYFETQLVTDTWETSIGNINVSFYTRSLSEILSAIFKNNMVISKLEEPMPDEKFKDANEKKYVMMITKPRFIFIEAKNI